MAAFWKRKETAGPGRRGVRGPVLGGVALGDSPWLVLGGGGLKGLAHLGAWRALSELEFQPVGILGTSIGALVGACLAAGRPLEELEAEARALQRTDITRVQRRALWVNGIRSEALFRRDTLLEYLKRVLPRGGWEALSLRFQTNAVELGTGRTEWFGIGARTDVSMAEAVYASSALPVFYPPARLPGGVYVDGGAEDVLPLARAAALEASAIVAVDVGSGETADTHMMLSQGMLAIHERTYSLMAGRRRREQVAAWSGPPLLYVRPALDGYGTFDFGHAEAFMKLGYQAVREAVGSQDVAQEAAVGG